MAAVSRREGVSEMSLSNWRKQFSSEGNVVWYNNEHRHSRIRFVTPAERHRGLDHQVLARRHELYERAKENKLERWSGRTRNREPIGTVLLNPDREQQVEKRAA